MAAVRDLVYKGTCYLDEVAFSCLRYGTFTSQIHLHQLILPEILETLGVLGIEVSSDSFSSNTENAEAVRGFCSGISTRSPLRESAVAHEKSSIDPLESVKEELGDINADNAINVKEEVKDVVNTFEGITVESIWSTSPKKKSDLKFQELQVSKLNLREQHCEEKDAFSCLYPTCKLVFESRDLLKLHIESQHSSEKPLFSKDHGSKSVFVKKGSMKAYIQSELTKSFDCDFKDCNMAFTTKVTLKRHIKSVHSKEKPYQCSQCLKKFNRKSHLTAHIEDLHMHNKVEPYQCDQCFKKFSQKSHLTRHIGIVHKKEKPHACSQPGCAEMFGLKLNLRRHMIKVHNHEKPFPCVEQNCDEKFIERKNLRDHLRKAHGAAELVCGFQNCAATFTFQSSLWYHKKKYNHTDK